MDSLRSRASQLLRASVAENTASTYQTALACFNQFRSQYGFPIDYPGQAQHYVLFISYCFERGFSPATIKTYISGLSFYHKLHNWYDPSELFIIKKLLEGCQRTRRRVDSRAPVTPMILQAICGLLHSACYNDYEAIMFKAAYLLAYYGLLRVSEIVHSSRHYFHRGLLLKDVTFDASFSSMTVVIRRSKTCQVGSPTSLRIPCEANSNMCAVCAMKHYFVLRSGVDGYFFQHQDNRPLTRSQFSAVLAKCIALSPFRGTSILSHSFRIGRASELAAKGFSEEIIMKLGRWRSSAYRSYIRF